MPQVPWTSQDDLLWLCCGKCTVDAAREIQIHHIDGDSGNDDPDNWTVLCLNCHSRAQEDLQARSTMYRKYTPEFLRKCRELSIESCTSVRIGNSARVSEGETISEELGRPEERLSKPQLVAETIKWLNQR